MGETRKDIFNAIGNPEYKYYYFREDQIANAMRAVLDDTPVPDTVVPLDDAKCEELATANAAAEEENAQNSKDAPAAKDELWVKLSNKNKSLWVPSFVNSTHFDLKHKRIDFFALHADVSTQFFGPSTDFFQTRHMVRFLPFSIVLPFTFSSPSLQYLISKAFWRLCCWSFARALTFMANFLLS